MRMNVNGTPVSIWQASGTHYAVVGSGDTLRVISGHTALSVLREAIDALKPARAAV